MIIKKGTKYYRVLEELTKEQVDEYKDAVQKHYNTLGTRTAKQIKEVEDKAKANKVNAKKQLDELNAL